MKPSLRQILIDSHISAIAIAVLLFSSLVDALWGLWEPFLPIVTFAATAIAIRGVPYFSLRADRYILFATSTYFAYALITFAAAWLVSRWTYGIGPLRALSECHDQLLRRTHV